MRPRHLSLPIESARLRLRLPTPRDAPSWLRILRSRRVAALMVPEIPWTEARVRAKIARARAEARQGTTFELAIELRETGRVIGRVALKRVRFGFEWNAELAYWIAADSWGSGFAHEAAYALCDAGFRQLGLHRIDADALAFNRRSIATLRRLGFRTEGARREEFRHRGAWIGLVCFGLLRGELRAPRPGAAAATPESVGVRGPRPSSSSRAGAARRTARPRTRTNPSR